MPQAGVRLPDGSLLCSVTLEKFLISLRFRFLTCKIGILIVTGQGGAGPGAGTLRALGGVHGTATLLQCEGHTSDLARGGQRALA